MYPLASPEMMAGAAQLLIFLATTMAAVMSFLWTARA